ncbi:MAG: sugar nucleotide-binding protein [Burkholderiaceae bacterium]|nr:sugar nucleotide-binding protein [Burkholderiaceae bacterium]
MRLLLFGRNGQVGWELERCLCVLGDVVAVDRVAVDLIDVVAIRREIARVRPDVSRERRSRTRDHCRRRRN